MDESWLESKISLLSMLHKVMRHGSGEEAQKRGISYVTEIYNEVRAGNSFG
jgi:hypothetical protein